MFSRFPHRYVLGLIGCALAVLALTAPASQAAGPDDPALLARVQAAVQQANATGEPLVRFDGGYYDATTRQVYVDEGAQVLVLVGDRLVPAPDGALGSANRSAGMALCNPTARFTHCERVVDRPGCDPATVWLNYDPRTDHFSTPWGSPAVPGEGINVRNYPYRTYGPRGVRVYRESHWAFMSDACLTGG